MSGWVARRFWKEAGVAQDAAGFAVELDGRRVRTPAKAPLILPTRALAQAVADEWDAQDGQVQPATMPFTRTANSAIDKVTPQFAEVAGMLAAYGDSDLLCYRAEAPQDLIVRQATAWDPALDWAAADLGARLSPRQGIVHAAQDPGALRRLSDLVHALTPFQLAAFHDLVALTGSLVLGFAATRGWRDPDDIWAISRLDELWQEELWGRDDEAHEMSEVKRAAFLHAHAFFHACTARD
ncbi:MAG: ATPase [Rhodobacteraceae bacterium]|nr:MAG: ATPase [Paracoccaceae bacterium]